MNIDQYLDWYNEAKEAIKNSNVSEKMKDMLYNCLQKELYKINTLEWQKSFTVWLEQCFYYLDLMKWKTFIE